MTSTDAPMVGPRPAPRDPAGVGWVVLAIAAMGTLLRLSAVTVLRSWEYPEAMEHKQLALGLLRHGEFLFNDIWGYGLSSIQSPPYPLLLAGLYWVFGPEAPAAYVAAMTINAVAGGLTVWLTYRLAREIGASVRVGLLAAAAVAFWPTQIYTATVTQAIALIVAGTIAVMILWHRSVRSGRLAPWVGFSVVGTLTALTEPVMLPVMALSGLLVLACRNLSWRVRLRNAAILLFCAIVVIGPWTVRNRLVHGRWVPVKNTFWVNMWKGNNPNATGADRLRMPAEVRHELMRRLFTIDDSYAREHDTPHQYAGLRRHQSEELQGKTEAEREEVFKRWATQWIAANPGRYAELCLERIGKTLWIDWDNPKSWNILNLAARPALLILSAIGLVLAVRRRWALGFPLLVTGSCLLTYTLTITAARFILPLEPLMLCWAALALVEAGRRLRLVGDDDADAGPEAHTA